jgi:CelD/BcsL family acetyltransferase involved in cellulose biosynthesis
MRLTTELITTDNALEALRPEWHGLWRQAGGSPFQSPDWLLPWWHHFGTTMPRVAILRCNDQLRGLLPLYILDDGSGRKLLPIGVGLTDYFDILLHPGAPDDTADFLLELALSSASVDGVSVCDLPDLPIGARLQQVTPPVCWSRGLHETIACPVLTLPANVDALRQCIPAATLRKLRMNRNRAERVGGFATDVADSRTLCLYLEALFRLHQARWTERGELGVLSDPRVVAFHRQAAPGLLESGALRLQVLRLGEHIAAVFHALLGRDSILFYLSGFDPHYGYQSPGTILFGAMLETAIAEGRREVHFLRGAEAYKHAWGGVDRFNVLLQLVRCAS